MPPTPDNSEGMWPIAPSRGQPRLPPDPVEFHSVDETMSSISPFRSTNRRENGDAFGINYERQGEHSFSEEEDERINVALFANENTFKQRAYRVFFTNRISSIAISVSLALLKLATCILYVIRVVLDDASKADCYGCDGAPCEYLKHYLWPYNCSEMEGNSDLVCWEALRWIQYPVAVWEIQVSIAAFTLSVALFSAVLKYNGNIWKVLDLYFLLELLNTIPFIATTFSYPLRNLFIPAFLNCWLAKHLLEDIFSHHKGYAESPLTQQVVLIASAFGCLVFTAVCGFQHIQRVGCRRYDIFESFYFVVVTLSTVGFGDLFPDIWLSKLFMVLMICVALAVLPKKFETLAYSWMERQKSGGIYRKPARGPDRHVVMCTSILNPDALADFLNEFYSYSELQELSVVLLCPNELDMETRKVLMSGAWSQRVVYIRGSCMKDVDLRRVKMKEADACFILGVDTIGSRTIADEHTILRSWSVKDFAPNVPQYIQIFRPENKVHVKFAEFAVCEDEIKYAMLANNCICPGASTLVTLLLHTSRGLEGQTCEDDWLRLYGRCSGNEIYHVILGDSVIFGDYAGKSFTYTSLHVHRKYGVTLIGVRSTHDPKDNHIKLNPGPSHTMQSTDICFYVSMTKEENMSISIEEKSVHNLPYTFKLRQRDPFFRRNMSTVFPRRNPTSLVTRALGHSEFEDKSHGLELNFDEDPVWLLALEECEIVTDYPHVTPYVGTSPTLCHLRTEKRRHCCLDISTACIHCAYVNAHEYKWPNGVIILIADDATSAIYNFIIPLRAHYFPKSSLQPIVILLENRPDKSFLDIIAWFPLIYFMIGSMNNLDDLLRAGILLSDNVVIANKENDDDAPEDDLADSTTIVTVQSLYKLFPKINITTELSQSSNMKFMHFQASNVYSLYLSEIEQREKEQGSTIPFMFRIQFSSGNVFSANMVDTLLYQAFVKDYIISLVRLLLGINQSPGSAFLTCVKVTSKELRLGTYGALFAKLSSAGGDVPIGIYRTHEETGIPDTEEVDAEIDSWESFTKEAEDRETSNLVRSRMQNLGISYDDYEFDTMENKSISYVIINPSAELNLEEGDIIMVLRPNTLKTYPVVQRASMASRSTQTHGKKLRSVDSYASLQSNRPHASPAAGSTGKTAGRRPGQTSRAGTAKSTFDQYVYRY